MPLQLIVNADDFGLTPGINRAIIELHQAGIVTSASLMATAPAFRDAVELAKANPGLGIGCHVTFVDGVPAAHPMSIQTLLGADGKTFRPSLADFTQAVLRRTVNIYDVARETQAQIQHLQRAGVDVTHVDTHKHVHLHERIAEPMLHVAMRCGVTAVRRPFEPQWSSAQAQALWIRRMQQRVLNRFSERFDRMPTLRSREILTTDGTLGIAATGTLDAKTLRATLAAMPSEGLYELCCHPGFHDTELEGLPTALKASREAERAALLELALERSTSAGEVFGSDAPPSLIHYGNLGIPGLQRASGQFQPPTGFEKVL